LSRQQHYFQQVIQTPSMQFEFTLGQTKLNQDEAKALLAATEGSKTITIDILNHIDPKLVDSKKLFSLSVERKNPQLATLAARFAIEGVEVTKRRRQYSEVQRISDIKPSRQIGQASDAIAELNQMQSMKSLGASMILASLAKGQKRTLRQVAVSTVNELAFKGEVSADSACFRGFMKDGDDNYKPVDKRPGIDRSECFHTSPVYTSLREGLSLLMEWGMVKTTKSVDFGSKDGRDEGNLKLLRRTVYNVELTELGIKAAEQWADINKFISHRWSQRVRTRYTYAAA